MEFIILFKLGWNKKFHRKTKNTPKNVVLALNGAHSLNCTTVCLFVCLLTCLLSFLHPEATLGTPAPLNPPVSHSPILQRVPVGVPDPSLVALALAGLGSAVQVCVHAYVLSVFVHPSDDDPTMSSFGWQVYWGQSHFSSRKSVSVFFPDDYFKLRSNWFLLFLMLTILTLITRRLFNNDVSKTDTRPWSLSITQVQNKVE